MRCPKCNGYGFEAYYGAGIKVCSDCIDGALPETGEVWMCQIGAQEHEVYPFYRVDKGWMHERSLWDDADKITPLYRLVRKTKYNA